MANGYSAGDLNLSIQTIANDTLKSLDAVIERLNLVNNGLGNVSKHSKISQINATPKQTKKQSNTLLDIGKWTAVLYTARKLGRITADIVQSGADYAETLNLWQVAMGDYTNQATIFVNKMNEAYGISEKTLMNAQATFKNMLGSLGNITDDMAYQLSESVTRMAIDYASLYNVGIEEAMTKFQAALAGQVRPIRSVSGYDITENTLYQLYQSIGGTKTMRQLSQTEKRLLAIYAIFNQMSASGAIGDMKRTINSFANQSRIMAESFTEVKSYSGLIATDLIETLGIMQGINSVLAFMSELLKGIATVMGAVKGQGGGAFESIIDGADGASKAIDEVNGKLLGFDKFRSLSSTEEEKDVSIDETLTNAMANYNKSTDESVLTARELAKKWLENVGLIYDAESGTYSLNAEFEGTTSLIGIILSGLLGILTVLGAQGILGAVGKLSTSFGGLGKVISKVFDPKTLGIGLIVGLLYYLYTTNEDFRESVDLLFEVLFEALSNTIEPLVGLLVVLAPLLATILTAVAEILTPIIEIIANIIKLADETGVLKAILIILVGTFTALALATTASNLAFLASPITWIIISVVALIAIIVSLIKNFDKVKETVVGAWEAIKNFAGNIIAGIANTFISIVNFIVDMINAILEPMNAVIDYFGGKKVQIPHWEAKVEYDMFANGGLPDKGTMFVAGEAGAEVVYNNANGQSGVANVQQIAQATYQGTTSALRDWWGGTNAKGDIPQLEEANATGMYQAVTGVAKSYGNKWSQY